MEKRGAFERQWWTKVDTIQTLSIETHLYEAKEFSLIKVVIGNTGIGKTFTVDSFVKAEQHVISVTVGGLHSVVNVIDDIMNAIGLEVKGDKVSKLRRIEAHMATLCGKGVKPLIILDEAENLKLPVIGLMKQFYDTLVKPRYCGIVLIGTPQLTTKLEKLAAKNRLGVPQFLRRIKSGIENVSAEEWYRDTAFTDYLRGLVKDDRIITLLKGLAANYGEVNDYVEPAMREAELLEEEFTYEFFCEKYRL